jgi:hypothetical protein
VKEILDETNRFSKEKIMQHMPLQERSIWANWMDVTIEELKAFLGVILNMDMIVKYDLKNYFSEVNSLSEHPAAFTITYYIYIYKQSHATTCGVTAPCRS